MIAVAELAGLMDRMCPMHVLLDATGHIRHVGPTLGKLRPDSPLQGRRFLEVFELRRPRAASAMAELLRLAGENLRLQFRDAPHTGLKGAVMPLPRGQGAVVNLSFGISLLDAVRDYALTSADFAATDLAIELLYLVEAKSAAMEASRTLNLRLQAAMIAAEEQAFTDTLTGLKNRRAANHVLGRLVAGGRPFALLHLDLDFFKAVNDSLGHAAGDQVLQQVARIMVRETREVDTVARVGGDEFVLILEGLIDRARIDGIARRLIARIEAPIPVAGHSARVSASIGVALAPGVPQADPADLLHRADLALYAAKAAGRGCWRFHDPAAGAVSVADPGAVPDPRAVPP